MATVTNLNVRGKSKGNPQQYKQPNILVMYLDCSTHLHLSRSPIFETWIWVQVEGPGGGSLEHWNAPNRLEPQCFPQVLLIFGPKNGPRWSLSNLTPPFFCSVYLFWQFWEWNEQKNLEPPELLLLCCFGSFCKLPFFDLLPLFVPFSEYLGHCLAQSVAVPAI